MVLLVISAFVVDFGTTWLRRGELQQQADKAALFAAEALPAADDADAACAVAKRAAYYIACYPVPGQRTLDPAIPACPGARLRGRDRARRLRPAPARHRRR